MTKRHPLTVVALSFFTFTVYAYWWLYKTTEELRDETGRDDLSPIADVVLTLATFGLWGIWAVYRNAKIAHEELLERGAKHTDRSVAVGAFAAMSLLSGWAWLVSVALVQEDLNRLADSEDLWLPSAAWETANASPVRARVELGPEPEAAPASAGSEWERAPSAPVFESSAPMPIVF